jgi:hypothetical protein
MDPSTLIAFASWAARACCDEPEKIDWLHRAMRSFFAYSDLGPFPADLRARFRDIKRDHE